jgi:hypothetical protein
LGIEVIFEPSVDWEEGRCQKLWEKSVLMSVEPKEVIGGKSSKLLYSIEPQQLFSRRRSLSLDNSVGTASASADGPGERVV